MGALGVIIICMRRRLVVRFCLHRYEISHGADAVADL
jgi:hypothetical protein